MVFPVLLLKHPGCCTSSAGGRLGAGRSALEAQGGSGFRLSWLGSEGLKVAQEVWWASLPTARFEELGEQCPVPQRRNLE